MYVIYVYKGYFVHVSIILVIYIHFSSDTMYIVIFIIRLLTLLVQHVIYKSNLCAYGTYYFREKCMIKIYDYIIYYILYTSLI
jgi:hypothetical protein